MKRGAFLLSNVDSSTFDLFIQDRPDLQSPKRRSTTDVAFGQDGVTVFDEEAYDDTEMTLGMYMGTKNKLPLNAKRNLVTSMFIGSGGYNPFVPYWDPTHQYQVMLKDSIVFRNKVYFGDYLVIGLTLSVKPWKIAVPDVYKDVPTTGLNLSNVEFWNSKPIIRITGSGDVTLFFGTVSYDIKGIVGSIVIDTELKVAYKESAQGVIISNESNKLYFKDWPVVGLGTTQFRYTKTASITKVEIRERWRSLV